MARARPVPGFAESASFREAAVRTIEIRTQEVFDHRAGYSTRPTSSASTTCASRRAGSAR